MSEVKHDAITKLAQFTPATPANAMELLFAAGRASARTHWTWKLAVAGLLVANITLVCVLAFREREVPATVDPAPAEPPPTTALPPAESPRTSPDAEPWSLHTMRKMELDSSVKQVLLSQVPTPEPLTVLSARDLKLE
jgi:hypothetical protein